MNEVIVRLSRTFINGASLPLKIARKQDFALFLSVEMV
jgi:hypothetical protein